MKSNTMLLALFLLIMLLLQGCWIPISPKASSTVQKASVTPLPRDIMKQTPEEADRKSVGCISCHGQIDAPTMHRPTTVRLGCVDCHGGRPEMHKPDGIGQKSAAYREAKRRAHVQPRFPRAWQGSDGKPSYSFLNREDPRFRTAHIEPGFPQALQVLDWNLSSANPTNSSDLLDREDPRFIRFVNPGDLRVAREVCGACHAPEVMQVESSMMTATAADNNGHDSHLLFLGANEHSGDFRSSGCSACHVVYANDRDAVHSGPYARFGNRGTTQTQNPTIPKQEMGHPIRHEFTRAIPTSQCMVCHSLEPTAFLSERANGRPNVPVRLKDIHHERGMHCVDCHFAQDVHGTGKLHGRSTDAVEISCQDCHGTIYQRATLRTSGPAAPPEGTSLRYGRTSWKERRFEWRGRTLYQRSMVYPEKEWEIVQVKDTIDPTSDWARAHPERAERSRLAKTLRKDGVTWGEIPPRHDDLAHSDERMACFSCHTSWTTKTFTSRFPHTIRATETKRCTDCHISRNNDKMPGWPGS